MTLIKEVYTVDINGPCPLSTYSEHGMSRSATIVLAYLMKKKRMTFTDSLAFLKDKKPDIRLIV